jgi:hypothetical protein
MNILPTVIGPAPSEMSFEELKLKLTSERERVRRGLDWFREMRFKPKGKKASAVSSLNKIMKESGLTQAQMLKGIELLKQQALSNKP